jgi:glutamate decarboxylase
MALHQHVQKSDDTGVTMNPLYSGELRELPRFRLSETELPEETSYQLVHDELLLDGNPRLNLATFVTTWMDRRAQDLMGECVNKNMINKDEYPQVAELERRCVNILADLWNAPEPSSSSAATGCSTTGSSEAAMLSGMALKWRWRARQRQAGQPTDQPNLVFGANAQVCWEKFCRYWDVEPRPVPVGPDAHHLTPEGAVAHCDANTIGVVAALGSTYDGSYEPVSAIAKALDRLQTEHDVDVPMHVDAASGGFIAPFIDRDLEWDFRLDRVQSINASGHKYGLVYPGVGWVVWRSADALPDELVFKVDYLGGEMPTFALNFSRPGAQVAAQYYVFVRLGRRGFTAVQGTSRMVANRLASRIERIGPFRMLTHGDELPVFAFTLKDEVDQYTVFHLSARLRERGWLVPAYRFPPNLQDLSILRIVVRNSFSRDLSDLLVADIERAVKDLAVNPPNPNRVLHEAFHH